MEYADISNKNTSLYTVIWLIEHVNGLSILLPHEGNKEHLSRKNKVDNNITHITQSNRKAVKFIDQRHHTCGYREQTKRSQN